MNFWVVAVATILVYLGAVAVLLASEIQLVQRRRPWRPRLLAAWSKFIGVLAFIALAALVFALMFSDAPANLRVPLELTFIAFLATSCTWLWFRMARTSLLAVGVCTLACTIAAVIFASVWAAIGMPATGIALWAPCALTAIGLVFATLRLNRKTNVPPRRRRS